MGCSGSKEARGRETGDDIVAPSGKNLVVTFEAGATPRQAACVPLVAVE